MVVEWCSWTAGNAEWNFIRDKLADTATKSTKKLFIHVVEDEMNLEWSFVMYVEVLNFWTQASSKCHRSEINTVMLVLLKKQAQDILPFKGRIGNATRTWRNLFAFSKWHLVLWILVSHTNDIFTVGLQNVSSCIVFTFWH